jgi:hypothetical protein
MKNLEGLIPVLQMDQLDALEAAREHLEEKGFRTWIEPFSEMSTDLIDEDWMIPENGGYIFYLEEDKFEEAMTILGDFFGYEPE